MVTAIDYTRQATLEDCAVTMAVKIFGDYVQRLPKEDAKDAIELFKCLMEAETTEDRSAAQAGLLEVLSQGRMTVSEMDLDATGEDCDEFVKWKDFIRERIRKHREAAGLTQVGLAEKTGLPQSHLSRIESGKHSPSHVTLQKIADALGIQVGDLDPNL